MVEHKSPMSRVTWRNVGSGLAVVAAALVLAACGSGPAHVIGSGVGSTTSPVSTPSTVAPPTTSASTLPTVPPTPSTTEPPVSSAEASQIYEELNTLENSLSQAGADLSNPNKGDQSS